MTRHNKLSKTCASRFEYLFGGFATKMRESASGQEDEADHYGETNQNRVPT